MKLEDILLEHGRRKNCGRLELDPLGVCTLSINNKLTISLEKSLDGKGFYLYGVISTLSDSDLKEIAITALSGNLFGRETGAASLGYEPGTHSLILFEYLEEEKTDFTTYLTKFEQFISYFNYWIEKIDKLKGNTPPTSTEETDKNLKIIKG